MPGYVPHAPVSQVKVDDCCASSTAVEAGQRIESLLPCRVLPRRGDATAGSASQQKGEQLRWGRGGALLSGDRMRSAGWQSAGIEGESASLS
eukprot:3409671-Prymnesium_polylepis.1